MKISSLFKIFSDKEDNFKKEKTKKEKTKKEKKLASYEMPSIVNSSFNGLNFKEAKKILKKQGENTIKSQNNISAVKIFAGQFKDFLVLILLVATIISIFMGELIEAVSISTILFLNAIMGFIQEYKTEKTLEALDEMVTPNACVIRDGKMFNIPANKLVEKDIIFVKMGDTVPADAVILKSNNLEVDESILTGESVAVTKEKDDGLNEENELNKKNIVYMGTAVVKGQCVAKIVATGLKTQMGKIADMLEKIKKEQTPLQKKLSQMGKIMVFGCLLVCFTVIFIGILRGEEVLEMVMVGLSLAVASVPEGLPAIVTIALAFAVKHMIKRKALVRKLHAVETLGCANVICTDKTGTITQNNMTVKNIVTANFNFNVTGQGLKKEGNISLNNKTVILNKFPFLEKILTTAVVCNSSLIFTSKKDENSFEFSGEPLEAALLVAASKAEISKKDVEFKVFDEIPFNSSKKFMTVFAKSEEGENFVFVKGAYDIISKRCEFYEEEELVSFKEVKEIFNEKHKIFSKCGMRVIAFAYKKLNDFKTAEQGLTFLGLCAMMDPPRKEAKNSVRLCKHAGIKTVMITGDNKFTARAIAKEVGIFKEGDYCLEGKEVEEMEEAELRQIVKKTTVFARVSPKHKLKIVRAFKKNGNVVAMTGDGVNDAPAIKEADIGVSMGKTGSEVTKEAADIVLLDDDFSTLVAAVEEGRTIYNNIRKFMRYLLSCNLGEVLTSLFAILMGMPIPLLPMQILLINLVTDCLPAIALGLEPKEKKIMEKPPRKTEENIFSKGLMFTIVVRGFLIALTTLTVFTVIFKLTLSIDLSRSATFLTLVSLQLIHVFECKSETKSIFKINHLNNKKLLFAVLISFVIAISAVWVSPFNKIIKNYPLNFNHTLIVIFFTVLVPFINAIILNFKNYVRRKRRYEKILKFNYVN